MLPLALLAGLGCGDDVVSADATGGAEGGAGAAESTSAVATVSTGGVGTTSGSTTDETTEGSSGSSSSGGDEESSSGSTGSQLCPDGIEVAGIDGLCVAEPSVVESSPAYDVLVYEGLVASNDVGVTQYRAVEGSLVEVSTVALPGRGHDLFTAYFEPELTEDKERLPKEVRRLLVTVPDADRLAVIDTDASGTLGATTLVETGARPIGITYVASQFAPAIYYCTANADDGTVSLFAATADATLELVETAEVGGHPQDIASIGEYVGLIDTDASTLTVGFLGEAGFEVLGTHAVPAGPVSVLGMAGSDTGPPLFLVVSQDADQLTLVRAEDGLVYQEATLSGGPSHAIVTHALWLPKRFRDAEFWHWVGAIAQTETSQITIGMHGDGRGAPVLDRFIASFPTTEAPVALQMFDANGDGNLDFVTASPTSGLSVVLRQ